MTRPLQQTRTKLTEEAEIELGQYLVASGECDEVVTKEAVVVKVDVSPKVLPCLALSCPKQSIVKNLTLRAMKSTQKQIDSNLFSASAAVLALLSIECESLRLMTAGTPLDMLLEVVLVSSFVMFGVELLVRCSAEEGYCWSAWFALDLLATLTLLMELRCFQELTFDDDGTMFSHSKDHAAHVGGQTAHALRVVRVLRLLAFGRQDQSLQLFHI